MSDGTLGGVTVAAVAAFAAAVSAVFVAWNLVFGKRFEAIDLRLKTVWKSLHDLGTRMTKAETTLDDRGRVVQIHDQKFDDLREKVARDRETQTTRFFGEFGAVRKEMTEVERRLTQHIDEQFRALRDELRGKQ